MQSDVVKERKQRWLYKVMDEIARVGFVQNRLHVPAVEIFVAGALSSLESERHQAAWDALWSAYYCLLPHPDVRHSGRFMHRRRRDMLKNELIILDLGLFVYRLEGSFLQLHDVVPYLWEKRKDFYPALSGALRASYWFRCLIEAGHKPEEAIERALKVRNELADAFGDEYIYYKQEVGELLSADALAKLRQILLGMANGGDDHVN
jgi:hypothetical protein